MRLMYQALFCTSFVVTNHCVYRIVFHQNDFSTSSEFVDFGRALKRSAKQLDLLSDLWIFERKIPTYLKVIYQCHSRDIKFFATFCSQFCKSIKSQTKFCIPINIDSRIEKDMCVVRNCMWLKKSDDFIFFSFFMLRLTFHLEIDKIN